MKNEKFMNQIKKNKAAATSTETIVEALYEEEKVEELPKELVLQPEPEPVVTRPLPLPQSVSRRTVGRPKGEETIQKTVYIPKYLWPFVQAAVKKNGGNLQSYFGSLLESDINRNRDRYKELAEIYRTLDGEKA